MKPEYHDPTSILGMGFPDLDIFFKRNFMSWFWVFYCYHHRSPCVFSWPPSSHRSAAQLVQEVHSMNFEFYRFSRPFSCCRIRYTGNCPQSFNSSSPRKFAGPQKGKYSRSKLSFLAGTMLKLQGGKVVPSNFKVNQNSGVWLVGCFIFGEGSEEKCPPKKRNYQLVLGF